MKNKSMLRAFLAEHDTVLSVPTDFNWAADYELLRRESLTIKQKVPLKMYLGIKKAPPEKIKIEIEDYRTYQTQICQLSDLVRNVEKLVDFLGLDENTQINFYSEFPRGLGLNFISCIAALLGAQFAEAKQMEAKDLAVKISHIISRTMYDGSAVASKFIKGQEIILYDDAKCQLVPCEQNYAVSSLFDVVIIYSGRPTNTEMSVARLKRLEDQGKFRELSMYQDLTNVLATKMKNGLVSLMSEGYSARALEETTTALRKFRYLWHIMDRTSPTLESLKNETVHALVSECPHIRYAVKFLNSSITGGSLMLIVPKDSLKGRLDEFMNTVNHLSGEKSFVIYNSVTDGWETSGITFIKRAEDNPVPSTKITFNTTENKVYIDEKRFSSKELPSQRQVIKLFQALQGKDKIYNDELERSSYSQNRYDLESKILIPFKRLVKKETGLDFPIRCRGNQNRFCIESEASMEVFDLQFEEV